jgi:hypothetical protein
MKSRLPKLPSTDAARQLPAERLPALCSPEDGAVKPVAAESPLDEPTALPVLALE